MRAINGSVYIYISISLYISIPPLFFKRQAKYLHKHTVNKQTTKTNRNAIMNKATEDQNGTRIEFTNKDFIKNK